MCVCVCVCVSVYISFFVFLLGFFKIPNSNLLLNSYFENPTIRLHVLYVLNMHAKFHANQM